MSELVRKEDRHLAWDPFGRFDSLFDEFLRPMRWPNEERRGLMPAVDVTETEHDYKVVAELPGVNKDDIDVSIKDGVLTINAVSRVAEKESTEGRVIRRERRHGQYVRSMVLGDAVDDSKIKAEYREGLLELFLPKVEKVKPRKIDVEVH